MSQIFPKNKEKRPRTSNESNNSFVKNVTSRVTGYLPNTIAKWFSSPNPSNTNGSTLTVDVSDSSEDEAPDTLVITQPPAKRMRFTSPGSYNPYGPSEAGCSSNDVDIIELPYTQVYGGTQYAQPSRNAFPAPMRPPNEEPEPMERDTSHMFKLPHAFASVGPSVANKRKSIFDTTSREEPPKPAAKPATNTSREPNKPSPVKPSLLGSPFYPGRTMYGGAAFSSYMNRPNINQQTVAVVNESKSSDDSAISSSARRVMDILESYSSPMTEARRIPVYTKPKTEGFCNPLYDRSPYTNRNYSYKTQELHVPSLASILRLKKKSRLMETTKAARQIIASHSSAGSSFSFPNYPTPTTSTTSIPTEAQGKEAVSEQPNKMTTKVKARVTRANRGAPDQYEVATPVKLPTAVLRLDEDKLPRFSFGSPAASKQPATSTPKTVLPPADKKNIPVFTSKPETVTTSVFKFSNPVKVSTDTPQAIPTPPKFKFGAPERQVDDAIENKRDKSSVVVGVAKEPQAPNTVSNEWTCSDCWVKNKADVKKCVCCGSQQPTPKAKCSVCKLADSQPQKFKCANCEKMALSPIVSPLTTTPSTKWKCEECWVQNEESATKCLCCGANKVKYHGSHATATAAAVTTNIVSQASTAIVKPVPLKAVPNAATADANWKCEDCWISNKSSVEKCAACGGNRPGTKQTSAVEVPPNTNSLFGSSDDKFKKIVKSQKSDTWECSICLVRNESDNGKCVCCLAEKDNKKKIPDSKFNFGKTANSFKFGIDPKVQEANITKKPEVNSTIDSKFIPQSETNNNNIVITLTNTPSFTFRLPTQKIGNIADASKEKPKEAPGNFTFGIPKPIGTITLCLTKADPPEKLQEVPVVDLTAEDKKPVITSSPTKAPTLASGTLINPLATDNKKDTPFNSLNVPTGSAAEKPKPAFTFGVTPSAKLFEPPASTAAPINLFSQQSQSAAVPTTSAPALPLFKPPEPSASSTSLFRLPEVTKQPPAQLFQEESIDSSPAPPMFTFGNNAPSNPAQPAALTVPAAPEKPKFQFTFGNNATPSASGFGMTDTNNASTNVFNLPAGTSLGLNNSLPSSTLRRSNGLTGTNGITGNAVPMNSLGSMTGNSLTGNTITMGNGGTLGGTNGLSANTMSGASSIQPGNTLPGAAPSMFNNTVQKENVWAAASSSAQTPNLFVSNSATSSLQKPPTFTFGSSTPFNAVSSTPTFGTTAAPTQMMFGMNNQNNNTPSSIFSNTVQTQPTGNLFGSPQPASNPTPQMPMFGTPSISATPTFGSPNQTMPSFEAPSLTPAPAPAFNFGAPQSTGIFGFGQQPQLQQQQMQQQMQQQQQQQQMTSPQQQSGVYSFGGAPAGAPQVQFSMGSGANPAVRRVRKAVRRNPQR